MTEELNILREWIQDLMNELGRNSIPGDSDDGRTRNEILRVLGAWRDSLPLDSTREEIPFGDPLINTPPYQYASRKPLIQSQNRSDFFLDSRRGTNPIVIWKEAWKE